MTLLLIYLWIGVVFGFVYLIQWQSDPFDFDPWYMNVSNAIFAGLTWPLILVARLIR